jgi:L-ribulokinase
MGAHRPRDQRRRHSTENDVLNQTYANVLNKQVLIPKSDVTSLGSAIFAAMAAGAYCSIEEAQEALCPEHRIVEPEASSARVYEELYGIYRELYFGFGKPDSAATPVGRILPTLRRIAAAGRGNG